MKVSQDKLESRLATVQNTHINQMSRLEKFCFLQCTLSVRSFILTVRFGPFAPLEHFNSLLLVFKFIDYWFKATYLEDCKKLLLALHLQIHTVLSRKGVYRFLVCHCFLYLYINDIYLSADNMLTIIFADVFFGLVPESESDKVLKSSNI